MKKISKDNQLRIVLLICSVILPLIIYQIWQDYSWEFEYVEFSNFEIWLLMSFAGLLLMAVLTYGQYRRNKRQWNKNIK